jgi:hypothetical protein
LMPLVSEFRECRIYMRLAANVPTGYPSPKE